MWIYADVRSREHCEERRIIHTAGERHQFVELKGRCKSLHFLQFWSTSDNDELDIIAISSLVNMLDRLKEQIDPLLLSNDAHISDKKFPPLLPGRVWWK